MHKFFLIFILFPNFLFSQAYCADNFSSTSFDNFKINFLRGKTEHNISIYGTKAYFYKQNTFKKSTENFLLRNDTLFFTDLNYSITFFPSIKVYNMLFNTQPILCKIVSHNLDDIVNSPSNFKACIDNDLSQKLDLWMLKGEFEKTVDFNERTKEENIKISKTKFRNEIEQKYIDEATKQFNYNNITIGKYDADNEFFVMNIAGLNSFNLEVPIADAPSFKKNFNSKNFYALELIFVNDIFEIFKIIYGKRGNSYSYKNNIENLKNNDSLKENVLEDICISGDCINGFGTYVWKSGSSYSGNWLNGEMSGFGTYLWATGKKYVGEWLNGKMHGEGVITKKNGDITTGNWNNGELEK